jgi:hypothetical protein
MRGVDGAAFRIAAALNFRVHGCTRHLSPNRHGSARSDRTLTNRVMIEKYRQQEADADQHSAYYHTSLHDCPPLGPKLTERATFGWFSDARVVRGNRAWICTFGQVSTSYLRASKLSMCQDRETPGIQPCTPDARGKMRYFEAGNV